jgi:hypothetical protein
MILQDAKKMIVDDALALFLHERADETKAEHKTCEPKLAEKCDNDDDKVRLLAR